MSTSYELIGTVHAINEEQQFASGFSKREFVVNNNAEKYPQLIKLEATKDACNHLNAYAVGDPITVSFDLRGNEYNGKYYISAQAWKFDRAKVDRAASGARSSEFGQRQATPPPPSQTAADDSDDIPF